MKISLNWLKTLIPLTQTPEEIEAILTATGLEVEHYEYVDSIKGGLRGLVVGEVKTCVKHPNADKLKEGKAQLEEISQKIRRLEEISQKIRRIKSPKEEA